MATRVGLFGTPTVTFGGERLPLPPGKTTALLLYLAYRGDWASRVDLVELFWRDTRESVARTNLRSVLSRSVGARPYASELEVEATRVRWRVDTDTADARRAAAEGRHADVYRAYGGELLEGFTLEGAPGFETWLEHARLSARELWRGSALVVCERLEAAASWERAAEVLGKVLEADPFDESSLRRRIVALTRAGRRAQATALFERFRTWLAEEVGAEPEGATTSVARIAASEGRGSPGQARTGAAEPGSRNPVPEVPARHPSRSSVPTPVSPIVGRAAERAELRRRLGRDAQRFVTLTGPGGIGKTRLAIAVAQDLCQDAEGSTEGADQGSAPGMDRMQLRAAPQLQERRERSDPFPDGVWFVACEAVTGSSPLIRAIADTLRLPLVGPGEPRDQLLEHLAGRRMLLVLDNLEQLRGSVHVLDDILERAEGVLVLTTSRELLGSRYEHAFEVTGLSMPASDLHGEAAARDPSRYDALALFERCAQRVREDFRLTPQNLGAVTRICRAVAGMPLAIELAATWLRSVTADGIAEEIARGLDILAAAVPNHGDRHGSVRAVFDYSWGVLAREERRVLARLSAFAGSFDLTAAMAVAGASVATLTGLVNKSLLAHGADGRYHLHPLVRRYAAERLAAESAVGDPTVPDAVEQTRSAHLEHYTRYLEACAVALMGGDQLDAMNGVAEEIDNVRAAWEAALGRMDLDRLDRQLPALAQYYMYRSHFHEWLAVFRATARALREAPSTTNAVTLLDFVLTQLGWCYVRLGRFQEAEAVLLESRSLSTRAAYAQRYPAGDARLPLSLMASIRGAFDEAVHHAADALELSERQGNALNERIAQYALARAAIGQRRFEDAEVHARSALASCERARYRWFMADCLLELGDAAVGQDEPAEADVHYAAALEISREFDNRGGVTEALNRRASLALSRRDFDGARRQYLDSLTVCEAVGNGREIARAECGLAEALVGMGEGAQAAARYRRALRHVARLRSWPLVLRVAEGARAIASDAYRTERLRSLGEQPMTDAAFPRVIAELEMALTPGEFR